MLINLLRSIHCRSALANGFFGGKKAFAANEKYNFAEIASYLAMTEIKHGSPQTKRRDEEQFSSTQTKRRTKNNPHRKRNEERRTILFTNENKN
nr:hypothetical protein [Bacteroidota bacterium]